MSKIVIIAKKEFHKSYKELNSMFIKRHMDYSQLSILIHCLNECDLDFQFLSWEEFENIKEVGYDLIVITHKAFLSGSLPKSKIFWQKMATLRNSGTNFLFLHHIADEFIENKYLDVMMRDYIRSPVSRYKIIANESDDLIANIAELLANGTKTTDEFTYHSKNNSDFVTLIEKIPTIKEEGLSLNYICFGFQKYTDSSRAFFVDIHSVGSKRKINGKLFEQVIFNVIKCTFNNSVYEDALIADISNSNLPETEKKALIHSRIGQGRFRNLLIEYWKGCSVTKIKSDRKSTRLNSSH